MNKKCAIFLTTILGLSSPNLFFTEAASAQTAETQRILDDYNSFIDDMSQFTYYLEQQQQQQMDALSSSCSSGNQSACNELNYMLDRQIRAQEDLIRRRQNEIESMGNPYEF